MDFKESNKLEFSNINKDKNPLIFNKEIYVYNEDKVNIDDYCKLLCLSNKINSNIKTLLIENSQLFKDYIFQKCQYIDKHNLHQYKKGKKDQHITDLDCNHLTDKDCLLNQFSTFKKENTSNDNNCDSINRNNVDYDYDYHLEKDFVDLSFDNIENNLMKYSTINEFIKDLDSYVYFDYNLSNPFYKRQFYPTIEEYFELDEKYSSILLLEKENQNKEYIQILDIINTNSKNIGDNNIKNDQIKSKKNERLKFQIFDNNEEYFKILDAHLNSNFSSNLIDQSEVKHIESDGNFNFNSLDRCFYLIKLLVQSEGNNEECSYLSSIKFKYSYQSYLNLLDEIEIMKNSKNEKKSKNSNKKTAKTANVKNSETNKQENEGKYSENDLKLFSLLYDSKFSFSITHKNDLNNLKHLRHVKDRKYMNNHSDHLDLIDHIDNIYREEKYKRHITWISSIDKELKLDKMSLKIIQKVFKFKKINGKFIFFIKNKFTYFLSRWIYSINIKSDETLIFEINLANDIKNSDDVYIGVNV